MSDKTYGFSKKERLKHKKEISRVITEGISLFSKHLKLYYIPAIESGRICHKLAVSVPKKLFKSAVNRNKIKRQIREIYRLNKYIIIERSKVTNQNFDIMVIYRSKKVISYSQLNKELTGLMEKVE